MFTSRGFAPNVRGRSALDPGAQRGVSLIEILVAVVVLSLGVISVVALQLVAKRNNVDAGQHTLAAAYANDLLDRMRINNRASALAAYLAAAGSGIGRGQQGSEPSPNCAGANVCSPEQLAAHDMWEFEQLLDGAAEAVVSGGVTTSTGGLVSPTACVTSAVTGDGAIYTVAIAWRGSNALQTNAAVACGSGAAAGGVPLYGNSDQYRRTLTMSGYITNF